MRVAMVLEQLLSPVPGGTGRYARELAAALAATAPSGSTVTGWVGAHGNFSAAKVPGVDGPHRLALGHRSLAVAWERGLGPHPRHADVVHAPTLLVPPRRRTPLVVTIHDAVPWTHPETLTPRGVAFHQRMGARAAATADRVVVPTRATAERLAEVFDLGDRVRVVPLGVAAGLSVPPDATARREGFGLPERYLVTVATLEPRKGLDVLLDALAEGGVDVESQARARGLSDRVLALGLLGDADLASVVSGALALVAPSREEGFGLPVLEAMALGTPAVISAAPALVEVAGGAAIVTPVGDPAALSLALQALIADPGHAELLRDAGQRRAAGFSWTAAAAATWSIYAEAAARPT